METSSSNWAAQTKSHLSQNEKLRQEVRRQFKIVEQSARAGDKTPSIGGAAVEDKLKSRSLANQHMVSAITHHVETAQQTLFQIRRCISELSQATTAAKAALSVVDLRIELRTQRPPSELIEDNFNDALQQEHTVLHEVIEQLTTKVQKAMEFEKPLEDIKEELNASRLTVHLDRSGCTQQLLDHVVHLEKDAAQFSREAAAVLAETGRRSKKALAKTSAAMKERIAATLQLKEQLEKDLKETNKTICQASLHLERLQKQLDTALAMPERQGGGGDFENKALSAKTGVLAELRSKIKAAAYTGTHGRQLDVLFGRFDRDRSGVLDEEEVRRALRRACRIPPSVVTDAEIASLCSLLDEDKSGTVSISEICDFLCADCNVQSLDDQCNSARDAIDNLKAAYYQTQTDLRNKVAAWKVDAACSRVTPIKGLKLDSAPPQRRPVDWSPGSSSRAFYATPRKPLPEQPAATTPRIPSGVKASPRKAVGKARSQSDTLPALPASTQDSQAQSQASAMEAKAMESVRSRIKAAADLGRAGKQMDLIFSRYDKDHSGQLSAEEVKRALRQAFKISPMVVSDKEIATLCTFLDPDTTGRVGVSSLVAFFDSELAAKQANKQASSNIVFNILPAANAKVAPSDESAGP
jgi:Ca2+-binding EF-hand superfamily protein